MKNILRTFNIYIYIRTYKNKNLHVPVTPLLVKVDGGITICLLFGVGASIDKGLKTVSPPNISTKMDFYTSLV